MLTVLADLPATTFDQGGLDGVSICIPSAVMPSTLDDGTTFPGQPFDLQPGASCSAANAGCQTLYCMGTECMRSCRANRDCNSGETCYGAWVPTTADTSVYEMLDVHYCIASDTVTYAGAGESCTRGLRVRYWRLRRYLQQRQHPHVQQLHRLRRGQYLQWYLPQPLPLQCRLLSGQSMRWLANQCRLANRLGSRLSAQAWRRHVGRWRHLHRQQRLQQRLVRQQHLHHHVRSIRTAWAA